MRSFPGQHGSYYSGRNVTAADKHTAEASSPQAWKRRLYFLVNFSVLLVWVRDSGQYFIGLQGLFHTLKRILAPMMQIQARFPSLPL